MNKDLHEDIVEQLDIIKTLISMEMINAASKPPTKSLINLHIQLTYAHTNVYLSKMHTIKYPYMFVAL